VAISDPATAHFTAIKNLGYTSIAYKPRHTHTHTHPETLEAREKPRVCLGLYAILVYPRFLITAVKCVVAGSLIATGV
jgi:hypothetical protein